MDNITKAQSAVSKAIRGGLVHAKKETKAMAQLNDLQHVRQVRS